MVVTLYLAVALATQQGVECRARYACMRGRSVSHRPQSVAEEVANTISHGVGLLAALSATPFLLLAVIRSGSAANVVGASIFAATVVLLYLASTLYHAVPHHRAKRVLRALDHGAIYLLIAGTYTPFTLGALRGGWGWSLFGVIWGLALVGVVLIPLGALRRPVISMSLYLLMGWLVVIAARPMWLAIPPTGLLLLAAGGTAYTAGVGFLLAKRLRFGHFVWHLAVLAGTTCHYFAVLRYAA